MSLPLTAADAAIEVARSTQHSPASPVVVHWQLSDFPTDVARQLLDAGHTVVWAYPSAERGEIAEASLKKAGITVRRHLGQNEAVAKVTGAPTKYLNENLRPFEQPRVDPEADRLRRANLTELQKAQLKALCDLADAPMGVPPPGCVTLISLGMLTQPGTISQLTDWPLPVVVLDHVTSLNVRWKDVRDGLEDFPMRVVTQSPDKYVPARLLAERIPQALIMRDEWACRLAAAYFAERDVAVTEIVTGFIPHKGLKVAVFSTDLVHSGFDMTTFLSIAIAGDSNQQLVGQGVIGALTPDRLSMSGERLLSNAVLKVTHPRPDEANVMRLQVDVSQQEFAEIRARDHVRTAMLAFGPKAKKPELVALVSPNLAGAVEAVAQVATTKLGNWGGSNYSRGTTSSSAAPNGTKFQHGVLNAMLKQLDSVTDGRRYGKVLELIKAEREVLSPQRMAMRLARLANCLTRIARDRSLDLAARAEDNVTLSDRAKKVTRLFNQLLDDCYPWKPSDKGADAETNLEIRRQVFAQYRAFRASKN